MFILFSHVHSSRNEVFLCGFNGLRDFNIPCSLVNKSMTPAERVFLSYCLTVLLNIVKWGEIFGSHTFKKWVNKWTLLIFIINKRKKEYIEQGLASVAMHKKSVHSPVNMSEHSEQSRFDTVRQYFTSLQPIPHQLWPSCSNQNFRLTNREDTSSLIKRAKKNPTFWVGFCATKSLTCFLRIRLSHQVGS